jgi:hypothetical protein
MLAIETTELEIVLPGVKDGTRMNVVVWDNKQTKKSDEIVTYRAPFKRILKEYDFILINTVN